LFADILNLLQELRFAARDKLANGFVRTRLFHRAKLFRLDRTRRLR